MMEEPLVRPCIVRVISLSLPDSSFEGTREIRGDQRGRSL